MDTKVNHLSFDTYQSTKHFPKLDGLRAVSILMVMSYHMQDTGMWSWLTGSSGVPVFFVLSGYLITMLALREEEKRGVVSLKAFYIRRSCRILPLYYFVLAATWLLVTVFGAGGAFQKEQMTRALPYYISYLNEFAPLAVFGHSWSLGIEEKFYLVWPVIAFVVLKKSYKVRLFLTGALIVVFSLLELKAFLYGASVKWLGISLSGHYVTILFGCLIALCLHRKHVFNRLAFFGRKWWVITTSILVIAAQLALHHFPSAILVYPVFVSLFLVSLILSTSPLFNFFQWRFMRLIGERSYGMYLIHNICIAAGQFYFPPGTGKFYINILAFLSTVLITLLVAEGQYRFLEKPCIDYGRRRSQALLSC